MNKVYYYSFELSQKKQHTPFNGPLILGRIPGELQANMGQHVTWRVPYNLFSFKHGGPEHLHLLWPLHIIFNHFQPDWFLASLTLFINLLKLHQCTKNIVYKLQKQMKQMKLNDKMILYVVMLVYWWLVLIKSCKHLLNEIFLQKYVGYRDGIMAHTFTSLENVWDYCLQYTWSKNC